MCRLLFSPPTAGPQTDRVSRTPSSRSRASPRCYTWRPPSQCRGAAPPLGEDNPLRRQPSQPAGLVASAKDHRRHQVQPATEATDMPWLHSSPREEEAEEGTEEDGAAPSCWARPHRGASHGSRGKSVEANRTPSADLHPTWRVLTAAQGRQHAQTARDAVDTAPAAMRVPSAHTARRQRRLSSPPGDVVEDPISASAHFEGVPRWQP